MESITERLTAFGFTQDEARFYLFLSVMGPTPISAIVRRFDINRIRVYRNLKRLEERNLVEKVMGRPVRYVAAPIEESLQNELDTIQIRLSELERTRNEIIDEWSKLALSIEKQPEEPRFRIHQGRPQVYDQLVQMCNKAENEISIVTTERDLHRLALYGFDEKLGPISERGTRIRIMTQVESADFEEIGGYYGSTDTRHVPLPSPIRFIVIDDSEALVTVSMDDSMTMTTQNDTGLWTNAASFISVMTVFFDTLWTLASDIQSIIEAMKAQRSVRDILEKIEDALIKNGWDVETPGTMIGDSGTEHTFNLVASNSSHPTNKVAFDVLHEEKPMAQIAGIGAKKIDLKNEKIWAVSPDGIGEQEKSMARLYGLQLIGLSELENLHQKIHYSSVEAGDA